MTNDAAVACHRIRMTEDAGHGVWRDGDIPIDEAQYWESADARIYIERAYSATTVAELRVRVAELEGLLSDTVCNLRRMANDEFADCEQVRLEHVVNRIEHKLARTSP